MQKTTMKKPYILRNFHIFKTHDIQRQARVLDQASLSVSLKQTSGFSWMQMSNIMYICHLAVSGLSSSWETLPYTSQGGPCMSKISQLDLYFSTK